MKQTKTKYVDDKGPNIAHNDKVIFDSYSYSRKKAKFCQLPMFYYLFFNRGYLCVGKTSVFYKCYM